MSDDKNKSTAIPTRHDPDIVDMVERLSEITGLGKAEIIRRAVRFALGKAQREGSLDFLLGDPDQIRDVLKSATLSKETDDSAPLVAEEGAEYRTGKKPKTEE